MNRAIRFRIVRTSLGALFALGVAGTSSAETMLTPEQTYTLAREAYLYAYPIVSMDTTMRQATNVPNAATGNMRAPVNQFAHARAYPKPDERDVVRFNFDTLYSLAWLDLSNKPLVLSVPDTQGRYYLLLMLDMWTDVFAVVGSRTTGTGAGTYAIVAPGWEGAYPKASPKLSRPRLRSGSSAGPKPTARQTMTTSTKCRTATS